MTDYGPLEAIVRIVGWLIAATAAVSMSWRGRTPGSSWEEDLLEGSLKVILLGEAVLIGLLFWYVQPGSEGFLVRLALGLLASAIAFWLIYLLLTSYLTVEKTVGIQGDSEVKRKILGGFAYTQNAKEHLEKGRTFETYFAGVLYDERGVWTGWSLALSKMVVAFSYILMVTCGTLALTAIGMLINFKISGSP